MIRYQSTTLPKGALTRALVAFAALFAAMFYLTEKIPKGPESERFFLILLGAFFLSCLAVVVIFFLNVRAAWEISEKGISESIFPRWKWLPFGVYRDRSVPWDLVVSVDDSDTVSSILGQEKKHFVVRLSQGDALRIYKKGSSDDDMYDAVLAAVLARGVTSTGGQAQAGAPRAEVPLEKGFWKKPIGRAIAIASIGAVCLLALFDLLSVLNLQGSTRMRLYLWLLPGAAIACWLAFGPDKRKH